MRPRSTGIALGAILAAGLALRLWSIDHGLPLIFNPDEELHFVPVAVDMFGGSLNPGYFENPPALTYLLHAVFRLRFTEGFPFGSDGFASSFAGDPEAAFLTARVVVALLGTLAAGLVWWAGSRFYDRRVGLVAAALVAFAFLPVFYSKQALNDVVTLAPVTAALVCSLLVHERGRPLDWALAGAAIGAATATKYTAGAMLAPLVVAAALRLRERRDSPRTAVLGLAGAGVAFAVAFLVLNPFSLLDFSEFRSQVGGQSAQAGGAEKLGQKDLPGWLYYLWTLTWGLGWVAAVAAVAGGVLAVRRDWRRAVLLLAFPAVLFLFLGAQARYFGRWFLPAYPALAILAAYAAVRAADALPMPVRAGRRWRAAALAAIAALMVAQGLVSSVRVTSLLGERDTRDLARSWLEQNVPSGSRLVLEPFVPAGFLRVGGREGPERYSRFPVERPFQAYEKRLQPALVDTYRRGGFCRVVVGSHQRDRGLKEGLAGARAYYERLGRESDLLASFSPYRADADPVEFNFDLSFNYLPRAYLRPGPEIEVRRLRGCRERPRKA